MGKEAKTNAMRILEREKVAYTAHEYPHEEGVAVDGVTVAASMGSTLFFAPCMVTSPWRRFPPRISSRLILLVPPDENGITGHSMGKEQLRFLPPLYQKG